MTPYEKWSGDKPNLEYLRVFGCRAFVHIPKQKRSKWDIKAKELMFVGYCQDRKGYRLIDPATHEIINARDVQFLEKEMYHQIAGNTSQFHDDSLFSGSINRTSSSDADEEMNNDQVNEIETVVNDNSEIDCLESNTVDNHSNGNATNTNNVAHSPPVLERSHREVRLPSRYQDFDTDGMPDLQMPNLERMCYVKALAAVADNVHFEPKNIDEALSGSNANHWKDSVHESIFITYYYICLIYNYLHAYKYIYLYITISYNNSSALLVIIMPNTFIMLICILQ